PSLPPRPTLFPYTTLFRSQAKQHFQLGDAYLQSGAYQNAITELEEAYQLFPSEKMHFALGQAYRMKGDKRAAADHYKKFLAAEPDRKSTRLNSSHRTISYA